MKGLINFEECLKQGLLRKIPPSKRKAYGSLKKAKILLGESKDNLESNRLNSAVLTSYLAMFDAAKSLLFKDGFREKSHACVARYMEEKYSNKIKPEFIELFDRFRSSRHETQYNVFYYPLESDAKEMIEFADKFIRQIEKIINQGV